MQTQRFVRIVAITFAALTAFLNGALAADPVKVRLHDGRLLNGELDPRTNDDALWLRFRYPTLQLSSSYAWSRVAIVQAGQDRLSAEEFRRIAADLKVAPVEPAVLSDVDTPQSQFVLDRRAERLNEVAKVASLWATARLANWDRDARMDGLEVCIVPRNSRDQLVPAAGLLNIVLLVQDEQPQNTTDTVARWSLRVAAGDFRDGCAVYRLPFRHAAPQNDSSIRSTGLLQVRLHAYGQGNFAADTPVHLRTLHAVLD